MPDGRGMSASHAGGSRFSKPDWALPPGVSRSLWEYAHDPEIARGDAEHLAGSELIALEERLIHDWLDVPDDVVDLGCGPGRLALPLARRGFRIVGIDLSPESLRRLRLQAEAESLPVATIRANLGELDCLPDARFGAALLMFGTLGMVQGAANRRRVLEHAGRVLRPGGRLTVHAHNVWRHLYEPSTRLWLLRDRFRALFGDPNAGDSHRDYRGIPGMYHHAFSWRELQSLLRDTGFRVTDCVAVDPDHQGQASWWLHNIRCTGWIVRAVR
jgi:SAM-dependent methyltransferase